MKEEVTICSVYHSLAAKQFIELNRELTDKLNPGQKFTWVVSNNAPEDFRDHLDPEKFKIVKGYSERTIREAPWIPPGKYPRGLDGFQHGGGLNKTRDAVKTRFAVFLDNNFYVVRPNWISDAIEHMKKHGLAFFGPPPDPLRLRHYRYFPNPHYCFFVDFSKLKLDKEPLDFGPEISHQRKLKKNTFFNLRKVGEIRNKLSKISPGVGRMFKLLVQSPLMRDRGADAGRKIYARYANDPTIKFEYVLPVIKVKLQYKIISFFYPERYSLLPKKRASYTSRGFLELGYFDAKTAGLEEYVWQGSPFGIHIRAKTPEQKLAQVSKMREILKNF